MNKIKTMLLLIVTFSSVLAQEQAQQQTQEQGRTLEEVTVEAEVEGNYAEKNSSAAMKSKMPLLNTPQSVQVFNRKFLEDIGAQNTEEVLNYSSGVRSGGYVYGYDYARIRGFKIKYNTYQDGLTSNPISPLIVPSIELYGIEKIELLKGPVSSLYGMAPIGGLLHYTSKKPKPEDFANIRLATDSYGSFEQGADVGFTNQSKNLYFRLVALNRNQNSFTNFAKKNRQYIAPSFTWNITKNTEFTVLSIYQREKSLISMGLPILGTLKKNPNGKIKREAFLGDKDRNNLFSEIFKVGYELQHEFINWMNLRHNFRYSKVEGSRENRFYAKNILKDNRTLQTLIDDYMGKANMFHADTAVDFNFSTFKINNLLTTGVDLSHIHLKKDFNKGSCKKDRELLCANIDIYNPQKTIFPKSKNSWKNPKAEISQSLGVYIQENAEFAGFTLSLAGRYDVFRYLDQKKKEVSTGAFSPKAGLSYEFIKGFSSYINYSESFENQATKKDKDGNSLDPQKGRNMEAGFKAHAFNNKLVSTLAVYQLDKTNIGEKVSTNVYELIGKQRSRGVEFDFSINPFLGFVASFAYTFTDTKVVDGKIQFEGKTMPGVPQHAISAYSKYTIPYSFIKGLGFGIGLRYFTNQYGDLGNTVKLPGYGVIDTTLSYVISNIKAQINFNNITNNLYFRNIRKKILVAPGAPFNVRASVTASF